MSAISRLSIVLPAHNESEVLASTLEKLREVLHHLASDWRIIIVDDGSTDTTASIAKDWCHRDHRIALVRLARSFGQDAAIQTGIRSCDDSPIVIMDADLQDPPDILPDMVRAFSEGVDIVAARRVIRRGQSIAKIATARLFYWLLGRTCSFTILSNSGEFRLYSERALAVIRTQAGHIGMLRVFGAWTGLRTAVVAYESPPRAHGHSKYNWPRMLALAWDAFITYSALPTICAMFIALLGVVSAIGSAVSHANGWTYMSIALSGFVYVALFTLLGLIASMINKSIQVAIGRPISVIRETVNLN